MTIRARADSRPNSFLTLLLLTSLFRACYYYSQMSSTLYMRVLNLCKIMSELTERQKTLLLLIIRDYIDTAQPVGSKRLAEHYRIDFSSATIRN